MIDPTVQQQDKLRPLRAFVSFLQGTYGDQTYAGQDGYAVNQPLQYQQIGPNGAVSQEGLPRSNVQAQAALTSPAVLILGGLAVLVILSKLK